MPSEKRKVILHYHLFKNAGTSLDAAFKENFSVEMGEWVTKEFPLNPVQNRKQVRQWILDNPQAKCFSSHTALLPVPEFDDIEVFPVIFVRHPIDRIASAYSFEKKQGADTFGSVLARNTDLKGYIETRLSLPHDRQCRNFHSQRLLVESHGKNIAGIIKKLPYVGLVDSFELSLELLNSSLKKFGFSGVELGVHNQNVSRETTSLERKLVNIKETIGDSFYSQLLKVNDMDLEIYELVSGQYQSLSKE